MCASKRCLCPRIGPGELLVQVAACGVCGSDVMDWYTQKKAPAVLGHEPAGVVAAVGAGVTQFKEGDRVFMHHHVPCFVCHYCRRGFYSNCETFRETHLDPGGFAEYVRVPALNVERDVLQDSRRHVLGRRHVHRADWHDHPRRRARPPAPGRQRRHRRRRADRTALHPDWPACGAARAITVLDLQDWRLDYARRMGADRTVNPGKEDAAGRRAAA